MNAQRLFKEQRYCRLLKREVHLYVTKKWIRDEMARFGNGDWVASRRRCSEAPACKEICGWAVGFGCSDVDPLQEKE